MDRKLSVAKNLLLQILAGIIFAFLNFGTHYLNGFNPVPLYADTLFTTTAAFISGLCGTVCVVLFHLLFIIVYHSEAYSLAWGICSLSVVIIVRLYLRKRSIIELIDVILLIFITAIIISLEGAVIFTILDAITNYKEDSQVRFMYGLLSQNSIPVFISALLPRVPVNILDKALCLSLGYLLYKWLKKMMDKFSTKKETEAE